MATKRQAKAKEPLLPTLLVTQLNLHRAKVQQLPMVYLALAQQAQLTPNAIHHPRTKDQILLQTLRQRHPTQPGTVAECAQSGLMTHHVPI